MKNKHSVWQNHLMHIIQMAQEKARQELNQYISENSKKTS